MPSINKNPAPQPPPTQPPGSEAAAKAAKIAAAGAAGALVGGGIGAAAAIAATQLDPKEVMELANSVKDSLTVKFTHDSEKSHKAWKAASKGNKLDKIQEAVKNGVSPTTAVSKSEAASKALNRSQKDNIAKFMRGVLEYGRVKESKNEDFTKMTLIQVLTKGIEKHGITEEQLKMIGNEDFTLADYLALVKNGESVV